MTHADLVDANEVAQLRQRLIEAEEVIRALRARAGEADALVVSGLAGPIEAEEVIRALRAGEADALVVSGLAGPKVYTLEGAEYPYRILIETMNEGAVTLQETGVILYANARFAEIVCAPLATLIGQPFVRFVAPADAPAFAALLARGLADRSSGALKLRSGAGAQLPVQISLRALDDESAAQVCMIITDMSAAHAASTQIRNALAEKELLLREVHHRVKNNLQIITSLLRLQARSAHNRQIAEALRDTQNRIRVMALVHEQLYRSPSLATIEIGDYLRSLGNSVYRSYSDSSAVVRLACDVTATLMLEPDLAIPLGLIVTELLVNSIKHAFPNGRAGLLQLRASRADDTLVVIVADDGVGFVPPQGPPTTLGLDLVTGLALQIGANLRIEHQSGTWVELRVPYRRNAGSAQRQP